MAEKSRARAPRSKLKKKSRSLKQEMVRFRFCRCATRYFSPCGPAVDRRPGKFRPADQLAGRRQNNRGSGAARSPRGRPPAAATCTPSGPWPSFTKSSKCPTRACLSSPKAWSGCAGRVYAADALHARPRRTVPEAIPPKSSEVEALQRNVLTLFQQIVAGSPTLSDELSTVAMNIEEPGRLVDFIASSLPSLSTTDKQDTLETTDVRVRLEKINQHLAKELEVQQLRNKIQSEVQDRVQQTQREYYLREQMKAIQKELGEQDEGRGTPRNCGRRSKPPACPRTSRKRR